MPLSKSVEASKAKARRSLPRNAKSKVELPREAAESQDEDAPDVLQHHHHHAHDTQHHHHAHDTHHHHHDDDDTKEYNIEDDSNIHSAVEEIQLDCVDSDSDSDYSDGDIDPFDIADDEEVDVEEDAVAEEDQGGSSKRKRSGTRSNAAKRVEIQETATAAELLDNINEAYPVADLEEDLIRFQANMRALISKLCKQAKAGTDAEKTAWFKMLRAQLAGSLSDYWENVDGAECNMDSSRQWGSLTMLRDELQIRSMVWLTLSVIRSWVIQHQDAIGSEFPSKNQHGDDGAFEDAA
ncbi:hypothetical protein F4821DRAFT_257345 [Hypoxylon rubiginosum]|uniref:Uncharacterized protein n=1 Tax=Hypoxylon rubiginosum TaxID=110542 RepID=A0ACC0D8X1_9PEZI|nr:hypothetical protein F4821DRAFT_257345 [Hypoxylon rubiginosum]